MEINVVDVEGIAGTALAQAQHGHLFGEVEAGEVAQGNIERVPLSGNEGAVVCVFAEDFVGGAVGGVPVLEAYVD